jgi:defect in organelle trafficking protein DotD
MKIKYGLLVLFVFLLVGCGPTKKHLVLTYITTDSAPVQAVDQNSQDQLAEAATAVGKSLQQLAAVELAIHPKAKLGAPLNPQTIGMAQQTSINWTGPVEPLLKRIAQATHYKLRILGHEPAIPVIVSIDSTDKPIATILRNATFQVVKKANITVYPASKVIELRYYS